MRALQNYFLSRCKITDSREYNIVPHNVNVNTVLREKKLRYVKLKVTLFPSERIEKPGIKMLSGSGNVKGHNI